MSIKMNLVAIVCVALATIHLVQCETAGTDLTKVFSELQEHSNSPMKFKDELKLAYKYESKLQHVMKTSVSATVTDKILGLISRWQRKLRDMNDCNEQKVSISRLCTYNWKKKQAQLESAITYGYFELVMEYEVQNKLLAALVAVNHLKSLRTRYGGCSMSEVLNYERAILREMKSCGSKDLNRLLGLKSYFKFNKIEQIYNGLKNSILPTDYSGRERYMESILKFLDGAYELKKKSIHAHVEVFETKSLGPVELRFEAHEETKDGDCEHCDNPPFWYEPPLPASYNNGWVFQCDNPNCRRRKELGLIKK